jgi:hypothetical protein
MILCIIILQRGFADEGGRPNGFFRQRRGTGKTVLGEAGDWEPAARFWHGPGPEWDVVSQTVDGGRALLGEVKWSERPVDTPKLRALAKKLLVKGIPPIKELQSKNMLHVLFVPEVAQGTPGEIDGVHVVTGAQVLNEMRRNG